MVLRFLINFIVNGKQKLTDFQNKILTGKKIHTIRIDKNNRWFKYREIHFATGGRKCPKYNCFKEGFCTGTQKIVIDSYYVEIDGRILNYSEIEELAKNDGFDCIADFWAWFDKPFEGKIIHWTKLKY